MNETYSLKEKWRQFLTVLLPILISQLALFSMTFADTIMSGHASPTDLAGVAIGASLWTPVQAGLTGILMAVMPMVAQMVGAGKRDQVPYTVMQALYLSVAIAVGVMIVGGLLLDPILNWMQLEPEVSTIARGFLHAIGLGIIPMFLYTVLRCFIDALGQTRVTMFITLLSLPINVLLNYAFIFGHFGLPRLGGIGAGYASAITYWCILLISLVVVNRVHPFVEFGMFSTFYRISMKAWKELLKLGLPIGFSIFCEVSIFAAVTLFMSEYSTITIAAHQAAMNFASFLYMVPLSISMALTIVVGFEVGAKRFQDAKQYSYLGIGIALGIALMFGVSLLMFSKQVAGFYTTDIEVLELAQHFLMYSILFLISDAVAAPIQGVLRGYKDVTVPFIVALVSYWVIGLPLGYILAKFTSLAAFGYWIGLITGLAAGAIFLFGRLLSLQKRMIRSHS
ncbi:MATE family efflux transporter [Brevibacillus sp. FSL K6-0770]|jgi:putative efflux protein, MATE family|uniref:Probable multidrug resistance protein NorM n=1 Tax=Brevibacillus parabrevis TaxID=54914 RepID=A0A4Y3PK50_BREPA|nr:MULTISPECIES: MATE family efflux transporter [Brevibacillus]MDH6351164.1 MATE family multidrug resistance protein [Brevibacillus sp. 1238]MDR4997592.1 MATE family efflux transporter [Brevibacillus parabrevis]MED2255893.1 MATE family efflux transporter [Brevibacillus parabrevis]RNB97084.1 MATE family efflux transporter [Brevibacillus parabrevis]GEB33687.1 putative multidrug resistance protein NorM [Brevibacillus parabrevis]